MKSDTLKVLQRYTIDLKVFQIQTQIPRSGEQNQPFNRQMIQNYSKKRE